MNTLSIGELARRAGVGVQTIRYYERRGLLHEPPRSEAGHRRYAEDDVRRLRFIRRAKELGFSLSEVRRLIDMAEGPGVACVEVHDVVVAKLADLDRQLHEINLARDRLAALVAGCSGGLSTRECPVLIALNEPDP